MMYVDEVAMGNNVVNDVDEGNVAVGAVAQDAAAVRSATVLFYCICSFYVHT